MDNGVDVSGLGRQDIEVKALRSLGFSGTLNDMRREFYQARRGDSFLSDAIAKNNQWNVG
ncbi:hypothetical protein [Mesobacillus maritimus]|uniref:Uncharacterized protein n=1 Tax=Mesobacillus maritimus TaxID=1643336 RepID=A0ABS7K8T3_9BACI|nr:hypothetical protein [Mesobacillus maritimus]MBY0098677.1 hypothetical protein [Mesobacillus maritimus]